MIGTYLVHGWMHLFMVLVDYRLMHGLCTCLWYMLSTWLRQVVDEFAHIHDVYS
jgi:hypothetical protein